MRGKEATCAALKSSKPLFRSDGGWQRASGFPFNPATAACTEFLSLHFPLQILFCSLLHYVALTKRRDFPDKIIPHSACLCISVPILTHLCAALKGHYLAFTMTYDCVFTVDNGHLAMMMNICAVLCFRDSASTSNPWFKKKALLRKKFPIRNKLHVQFTALTPAIL